MRILTLGLVLLSLGLFEAADPDIDDRFQNLEEKMRTLTRIVKDVVGILQQKNSRRTGNKQPHISEQIVTKNAENNNEVTNEENMRKRDKSRSKTSNNYAISKENDVKKMNDTDLKQRVQILEFQMNNVIDDVTTLTGDVTTLTDDVTNLEEDIETQINLIQADLTFIQADQTTLDQRILELETDTESLAGAIWCCNNNFDADIFDEIESLELSEKRFEAKLASSKENGTVTFAVNLGPYTSIPKDSVVVFQQVRLNNGNGYEPLTGEFTVPPGGGGLYHLEANFWIFNAEDARFGIRANGTHLCRNEVNVVDENGFSNHICGVTTLLGEGDIVDVFYYQGTDDTLVVSNGDRQNGFAGFRITPP